jgi:hypothetical protein
MKTVTSKKLELEHIHLVSLTYVLLSLGVFSDSVPKSDIISVELRIMMITNGENRDLERGRNGPFNLLSRELTCRDSNKQRNLPSKLPATQHRLEMGTSRTQVYSDQSTQYRHLGFFY